MRGAASEDAAKAMSAMRAAADTFGRRYEWRIVSNRSSDQMKYVPLFLGWCSDLLHLRSDSGKRFTLRNTSWWEQRRSFSSFSLSLAEKIGSILRSAAAGTVTLLSTNADGVHEPTAG